MENLYGFSILYSIEREHEHELEVRCTVAGCAQPIQ